MTRAALGLALSSAAGAGLQVPVCQPCSVRLLVQLCRGPEGRPLGLSYLVY